MARRTQAQRTEETRRALVSAAAPLFARHGFAATLTEDVVRAAGVTRGALYHHFASKAELFEAVFEAEMAALAEHCRQRVDAATDPWERFIGGFLAYMEVADRPAVRQVILLDAPVVLGMERYRRSNDRFFAPMRAEIVTTMTELGMLEEWPTDTLVQVLMSVSDAFAMVIADSANPAERRATATSILERFLRSLGPPGDPS